MVDLSARTYSSHGRFDPRRWGGG